VSAQGEIGRLSPDGLWRWDGARWMPTGAAEFNAPPSVARTPRSSAALAGGITSIVAAVVLLAACFFPYGSFPDGNGGTINSSIFNGNYQGSAWQIPEPLFVVLAAIAAAIVVIAVSVRIVRAVATGALIALGLQTLMMWITFIGTAISVGRIGPGGFIGLAGSIVLLVGGLVALTSLFISPAGAAGEESPPAS